MSRLARSIAPVIPAEAGIHCRRARARNVTPVIPAKAGIHCRRTRARSIAPGVALAFPRRVCGSSLRMADGGPGAIPFPPPVRRRSACASIGIPGSVLLALLFLFPILFPAADAYAQPRIGRLFSSPEQRIELDRLRDDPGLGTEAEPAAGGAGPESRPAPASDPPAFPVTVNGVVLRSDGRRVAWVNGTETATGTTTSAGIRIDAAPGRGLRIRWPGGRTSATLVPGQTIDAKGRVRDAYERRAAPGAPGRSGGRAADPDAREAGKGAAAPRGAAEPAPPPAFPPGLVRELLRRMPAGSVPPGAIASDVPPAGGG